MEGIIGEKFTIEPSKGSNLHAKKYIKGVYRETVKMLLQKIEQEKKEFHRNHSSFHPAPHPFPHTDKIKRTIPYASLRDELSQLTTQTFKSVGW